MTAEPRRRARSRTFRLSRVDRGGRYGRIAVVTRVWTVLFAVLAAAVFVLVEIWASREETAAADPGTSTTESTSVPEVVTASGPVDLSAIRIAADRHGRDYRRDAFGPGWAPAVGPGCDVRDVVLARDLVDTTVARGCDVTAGTLYDPYTGQTVTGPTRDLDVDHVIPLALAHRTGAHAWTDAQRERFANDPDNLRATTAAINRAKSDHGPEHWMPQIDACTSGSPDATNGAPTRPGKAPPVASNSRGG